MMTLRLAGMTGLLTSGLLLATAQPAGLAAEEAAATGFDESSQEVPFVLAIRGGVSLGAYESGLNWALLHFMKQRSESRQVASRGYIQLKAASGASAGSINAVLSSISWCIDDDRAESSGGYASALDDNVLRQTWLGIGFEELLPPRTDSLEQYRRDDGVLTRNAFKETIARIERTLSSDDFRPGCEVPVAITVTRVAPLERVIAGVAVHNQRFVIPLTIKADGMGRARILSCLMDSSDPGSGNVIYMQGTPTGDPDCPLAHSTADLVDAIEASSAFPVAFGRKYLAYCIPREDARGEPPRQRGACPDDHVALVDDFIDGGLFDNIPLGAARALAEPTRGSRSQRTRWQGAGRRFNYIYLDPTIRRSLLHRPGHLPEDPVEQAYSLDDRGKSPTFGLRSQLFSFLGGAIHSGRDYELYSLLRKGDWTNQTHALAERLQAAVRDHQDGTAGAAIAAVPGIVDKASCEELFATAPQTGAAIDSRRVQHAMSCISGRVESLEQQYVGVPAGGRLLRSGEVTALRNECLSWIARLAGWIDEPDLEWLAEQARYDKLGDRRILMSSRFSPVVGEMMEAFGGFVDRDFRDYDYYAGVYDAAWSIANFLCAGRPGARDCIAQRMQSAYREFGVPGNERADTVFLYLTRQEFSGDPGWSDRFAWAEQHAGTAQDRNMLAIAQSLFEGDSSTDLYVAAPDMTAFVTQLVAKDYDDSESSPFLKRIFKLQDSDEFTWYYPLSLRASNRLLYLEKRENEVMEDGDLYVAGLALGAFALHSYMQEEVKTFNLDSAPDFSWQAWLPDEIAVDVKSGGLDVSWYQGLPIGDHGLRWDFKFTPIQLNHSSASREDSVWFSQADFLISYKKHGIFSAVGLGPTASWTWKNWPDSKQLNFGAAMFVGLVEDKIRLTVGKMNFGDSFEGDNFYINIGVNDFPGLVYWAFPDWRGSWLPERLQW